MGGSGSNASRGRPLINSFIVVEVRPLTSLDDLGQEFLEEVGRNHQAWLSGPLSVYVLTQGSEEGARMEYIAAADAKIVPGAAVRIASTWNSAMQRLSSDPRDKASISGVERLERLPGTEGA